MTSKQFGGFAARGARRLCLGLALVGLTGAGARLDGAGFNVPLRPAAWRSIGPGPAPIEAAIAAHAPSHTVYIASFGGVLKSTDGGVTFAAASNGIEGLGSAAMAMAPDDPNIVYLGTGAGTLKTVDGGATWNLTNGDFFALSMAIDPTNSNVVYAGGNGFLVKTIDGGDTWDLIMDGMVEPTVFYITVDPGNPSVVYAGTAGEGGFRSADGGVTWTPLAIDTTVWQLIVDPSDSSVVYAGSNGNGVYKSTDGGTTFARIGSPHVGVVYSLARSGNRLYAGTATEGVSYSEDDGKTWRNTGAAEGLAMGLTADSSGAVYFGTNFEGAFVLPAGNHPDRMGEHGWRGMAWSQLKDCNCESGHAVVIDPSDDRHVFSEHERRRTPRHGGRRAELAGRRPAWTDCARAARDRLRSTLAPPRLRGLVLQGAAFSSPRTTGNTGSADSSAPERFTWPE